MQKNPVNTAPRNPRFAKDGTLRVEIQNEAGGWEYHILPAINKDPSLATIYKEAKPYAPPEPPKPQKLRNPLASIESRLGYIEKYVHYISQDILVLLHRVYTQDLTPAQAALEIKKRVPSLMKADFDKMLAAASADKPILPTTEEPTDDKTTDDQTA